MSELTNSKGKKIIAFYLPQFHTIPENDEWWGKGFTEWVNVRKAKPIFKGHCQPKVPLDDNYYDLSDVRVMEKQAKLAKEYGIYGFCYYHYWFKNGKQLLEKPVDNMLIDENVDIPFCLSWANENWSRNWDGGNSEVIMEQDYGAQNDWEIHFQYLLKFFCDKRYITYEGIPILLIYKPEEISCFNEMIDYWKRRALEEGLPGLLILSQHPKLFTCDSFDKSRVDYYVKFQPSWIWFLSPIKPKFLCRIGRKLKKLFSGFKYPNIYSYDEAWNQILNNQPFGSKYINGCFTDWDNTARKKNGIVFEGASPDKFGVYFQELLQKDSALNILFINAWNEWAEGAYLEPDEKNGYGYLEAIKKDFDKGETE